MTSSLPPDSPPAPPSTRRKTLQRMAGLGVAVVATGAGWAWWHRAPRESAQAKADAPAPSAAKDLGQIDLAGFWRSSFPTPAGGQLSMAPFRGKPLVVNFWAPWCPPCVHELPMLNGFYQQHHATGLQLIGLAVDEPTPVREFLSHQNLDYGVAVAGLGGVELMQVLGNNEGGLPYTIVIAPEGKIVDNTLGPADSHDLDRWLLKLA